MRQVTVWTDGAVDGFATREKHRPIGAGIIMECEGRRAEWAVSLGTGTSQQAELLAIKTALELLEDRANLALQIVTDSEYCRGVLTKSGWKLKHNQEIIRSIRVLLKEFGSLSVQWVKGHDKNERNNRADFLASVAVGRRVCPDVEVLSRVECIYQIPETSRSGPSRTPTLRPRKKRASATSFS